MSSKSPRIVLCGIHEQGIEIARFLRANGLAVAALVTIDRRRAENNYASAGFAMRRMRRKAELLYITRILIR